MVLRLFTRKNKMSLVDLLTPKSCVLPKKRFGPDNDGGYVMPTRQFDVKAIFGYGVGHDVSFENQLAELWDVPAHVFDHTVNKVPPLGPNTRYYKEGIVGKDETDKLKTFRTHLDKLVGPEGNVLLKIDVEGAEWDVIEHEDFSRVTYLVIEYHDLESDTEKKVKLIDKIDEMFDLVHIHGVNCHNQPIFALDRVTMVPRYVECTYIRKGLVETYPCIDKYPTEWDMKSRTDARDVLQEFWKRESAPVNFKVADEHIDYVHDVMTPYDVINQKDYDGFTFELKEGETFPYQLVYALKDILSQGENNVCVPVMRQRVFGIEPRITHPRATQNGVIYDTGVAIYSRINSPA